MSSWGPFVGAGGAYGTYSNLGLYGAIDGYGTLRLTETSPEQTFVEPLTNAEMYSYLKIPARSPIDQEEDDFITSMISGAREQAEILQNRDLVRKQWDLYYDYWMGYRIQLRTPLISFDLLQYTDSNGDVTVMQEGPTKDYIVDKTKEPGIVSPPYNGTWPTFAPYPSSALLFRFKSGYSTTAPFWKGSGARIKIGMKLLISAWYNNRIPFEKGMDAAAEYPYAVTSCLSYGSLVRAR
jgi:uncharacterized phiE125 gp8 family phage protein